MYVSESNKHSNILINKYFSLSAGTWFGSFDRRRAAKGYDIDLEKASMLFNIAALYSRSATVSKSDPNGVQ